MSYGTFESVASDGYEDNLREAAAVQSLDHAIERVSQRFGSFLCQATDRDDFNERVALLKPEIMKVVEAAGVMPVSGVMRKVVGSQKAKWRKVAENGAATAQDPYYTPEFNQFLQQNPDQTANPNPFQQLQDFTQWQGQQPVVDPQQQQAPVQQQYQDPAQYQAPAQQYQAPAQQYAPQQQAPADQQQYAPAQEQDDTYQTAGLEDAKDLVPSDDWDGYLQERDTPEREQIKTRNFNPKSAGNQVPKGKYFDPITEELYDDDGEDVDRTLPPGWYYDEITDQVYQDDDGFRGANKTADQGVMTYQDPAGTSTPVVSPDSQVPMDTGAGNTGTVADVAPTDEGYAAQTAGRKTAADLGWSRDGDVDAESYYVDTTDGFTLSVQYSKGGTGGFDWEVLDDQGVEVGSGWEGTVGVAQVSAEDAYEDAGGDDFGRFGSKTAGQDDNTVGEPTEPNTLNDAVLDGVDKGDADKVSDNIDTNTGDGSDSEGKNGKESSLSKADREFMAGVLGSTTHMATGYSPEEIDEMKEWAAAFGYLSNSMRDQVSSEDVLSIIKKEYPGGLTQWNDDEPSSMEDLPEPVDGAWEGTADIEPLF